MADTITVRDVDAPGSRSTIACHICRKRKIKCGRELPHCSLCKQSSQQCEYPEKALRPGPKIGSQQTSRKRNGQRNSESNPSHMKARRTSSMASRDDYSRETARDQRPLSPETSISSGSPKRTDSNIQSLSFIIHPSHESCSPEERTDETPRSNGHSSQENQLSSSCYALGLDPEQANRLISRFFETFTSFQLYREHEFRTKLELVATPTQTIASLASMLAFATKIDSTDDDNRLFSSYHFSNLASKYVELAIQECEDEPLPLPLLQALILHTHWLLIHGVKGRAWRYLGIAIRSAYELNMHLIDSGRGPEADKTDPNQWCEDEERRRSWWAIWEMDVFASVIRRCPTGIDWSQNETFLPAEDENWIRGKPQRSCILESNLVHRWKTLEATGNQSSKAWFIVINSLMKDAQKVTSPTGVNNAAFSNTQRTANSNDFRRRVEGPGGKEALTRLSMIHNALQCTVMALPKSLKYQNQYLNFGCRDTESARAASQRLLHSSIYSINMMIELAKLMIYKYYIFRIGMRWPLTGREPSYPRGQSDDFSLPQGSTNTGTMTTGDSQAQAQALEAYSEASTAIVLMVRRSFEEHYKYVNPFLANTIWLAGAVQLLYRELAPMSRIEKDLTNSNFDLLSMTYNKFVSHWNMSPTLQKNLERVEFELENLPCESRKADRSRSGTFNPNREQVSRRRMSAREERPSINTRRYSATSRPETAPSDTFMHPGNEGLVSLQNDCADVHNHMWSTVTRNDQTGSEPLQYNAMEQPILTGETSASQGQQEQGLGQQSASMRLPSGSVSASMMPVMAHAIRNHVPREDSSIPFFANPETDPVMAPDFLDSMPFTRDLGATPIDLSSYLDEILSGSYMA